MQTRSGTTQSATNRALEVAGLCRLDLDLPEDASAPCDRLDKKLAVASNLRAAYLGGVAALVGEPRDETADCEEALLQRHELLLEVGRAFDTIPARWGSRVESIDWLADRIEERRASIEETFDRVSGCVERVLRIPRRGGPSEEPTDDAGEGAGRAYLEKRRQSIERPPADDDEQWSYWRSALEEGVREMTAVVRPEDNCEWYAPAHLELTLLVPERHRSSFVDRVRGAVRSEAPGEPVLTRPMPPYSFAQLDWTPRD